MNIWRCIVSPPSDGPENMALDEALFSRSVEGNIDSPVFRIYTWSMACVTIGYFQRHDDFLHHNLPVTRRLTGGLSVRHGRDISYSFVAREDSWPNIYDQEETYRLLHSGIKAGLNSLGYAAAFCRVPQEKEAARQRNSICVDTLYPYDLHIAGKKVAGSSQRQRGKTILVQGSIHIPALKDNFTLTARSLSSGWEQALGITLQDSRIDPEVESLKEDLKRQKYVTEAWNKRI